MGGSPIFSALRARYEADRGDVARDAAHPTGGGLGAAETRLERVLDTIGWRAANGVPSDEVAPLAAEIVRACVTEHRDVGVAIRDLAILLHACAAPLDGSMYPPEAFEPAADELLWRYAND